MELVKLIEDSYNKGGLINTLQKVQEREGYLSSEAINLISEKFSEPVSKIYGVVTFYSQFRLRPLGRHTVKVCRGTACHVAGSLDLATDIREILNLPDGEDTTKDRLFTLEEVACIGCCSLAPAVMIDKEVYARVTAGKMKEILDGYRNG